MRMLIALVIACLAGPAVAKPTLGLRYPNLTPDGKHVVFCYRGDIWVADVEGKGTARRLTIHEEQETLPRISPDGKTIAFTSTRNGGHDIFTVPVAGGIPKQITFHSAFEAMCDWSPDGKKILFVSNRDADSGRTDLYEMAVDGGTPRRITRDGASEGSYSPDGKSVVYIRGFIGIYWDNYKGAANFDIYTIPVEGGMPTQMTKTEGNERFPFFSKDGKHVFFLAEEKGVANFYAMPAQPNAKRKQITKYTGADVHRPKLGWDGKTAVFERAGQLYMRDLTAKDAKTKALKLSVKSDVRHSGIVNRTVTSGGEQVHISSDGRRAAFVLHGDIWTMAAGGGNARRLTSGPEQDQWPRWSPDGRTIAYFSNARGNEDIWLLDVRTGRKTQLTRHPRGDFFHNWSPDGRSLVFCSERSGNKDIWTVEIKTRSFKQLTTDRTADDDPTYTPDGRRIVFDSGRNGPQAIYIMDVDGSNQRRISQGSNFYQVPSVSPDGRMIVYEAMNPSRGGSMGLFVSSINGGPSTQISPDGSTACWRGEYIYFTATRGGSRRMPGTAGIYRVKAPTSIVTGERISFIGRVEVDQKKELGDLFDEAWLALKNGFYDPKMHGVNWNKMKTKYRPMAVDAENKDEWANIIRQMLAELGASHLGVYPASRAGYGVTPRVVSTGILGADFAREPHEDGGRVVTSVVAGGPADKVGLRVGDVVTRIGSRKLKKNTNLDKALNGSVGKEITLGFRPMSAGGLGTERSQKITPTSLTALRQLKHNAWEKGCAELVKKETKTKKGEIAYIYLSQMNPQNLQKFQGAVAGWMKSKKIKGMILDVRGNGGGNIHNQLMAILTTKPLARVKERRMQEKTTQPLAVYWDRPTVVLTNERSFSDAEVFPYMFQAAGRGKVIGTPTAGGVIGTNDITLSDGTRFRIPRVGFWGMDGTNLEGLGVKPDIIVEETPEDRMKGNDPQLMKAIEVVQAEVAALAASKKKTTKKPEPKKEEKKPEPKPEVKPEPKPEPMNPTAKVDPMNPLADAVVGEWVRYTVKLPGAASASVVKVIVDEVTEKSVKFRKELEDGTMMPPLPNTLKRGDLMTMLPLFGQVRGHSVTDGEIEAQKTQIVHADVRWPDGSELAMKFSNVVPAYGLYKVTMGKTVIIEATAWGSPEAAPKAEPVAKAAEPKPVTESAPESKPEAKPAAKTEEAEGNGMPLNPMFDAQEGEWVRIKRTAGGREMEMTIRVDEVDNDEGHLILKGTVHLPDRELNMRPQKRKLRKHMRKTVRGADGVEFKVGKEPVMLTINDKELKCFTVSMTREGVTITQYFCTDIPVDGLVRVERDGETIMELVDWGTEEE